MKYIYLLLCLSLTIPLFSQADSKVTTGVVAFHGGQYRQALESLDQALRGAAKLKKKNVARAYYYRAEARIRLMQQLSAAGNLVQLEAYGDGFLQSFRDYKEAKAKDDTGKWSKLGRRGLQALYPSLTQAGLGYLNQSYDQSLPLSTQNALLDRALAHFNAALDIQSDSYLLYDLRGQVLLSRADTAAALADFQRARKMYQQNRPKNPDLLVAYVYYRTAFIQRYYQHQDGEALETLKIGMNTLDREYERLLENALDYDEATLEQRKAQYRNARTDLESFRLDIFLHQPGLLEEALKEFESALKEDPDNYIKRVAYANLLEQVNPDRAVAEYKKAIRIDNTRSEAVFNLAAIYVNRANEFLNQAQESQSPEEQNSLQQQGLDQFRLALPYLERAHILLPRDRRVLQTLTQISLSLDDTERYQKYRTKLKELEGN